MVKKESPKGNQIISGFYKVNRKNRVSRLEKTIQMSTEQNRMLKKPVILTLIKT